MAGERSVMLLTMTLSEDLNGERLNWIIEHVDEMFSELAQNENET